MQNPLPVILASSSPYRRQQLNAVGLTFKYTSPDINESPLPEETPLELACRLARDKAHALTKQFPAHLIIGSDQIACCDNQFLDKPGSYEKAKQQLLLQSGKTITFYTAVAIVNTQTRQCNWGYEPTEVTFRHLKETEIDTYLTREQPFNCAGSFKSEGLGISLFERISADDPSALIGLPLIKTLKLLRKEGIATP